MKKKEWLIKTAIKKENSSYSIERKKERKKERKIVKKNENKKKMEGGMCYNRIHTKKGGYVFSEKM